MTSYFWKNLRTPTRTSLENVWKFSKIPKMFHYYFTEGSRLTGNSLTGTSSCLSVSLEYKKIIVNLKLQTNYIVLSSPVQRFEILTL